MSKERKKKNYQTEQILALMVYGASCDICSNNDPVVLEFHHRYKTPLLHQGVYGPALYRTSINEQPIQLHRRTINEGYKQPDLMLLCANCHIKQDIIDDTGTRGRNKQDLFYC